MVRREVNATCINGEEEAWTCTGLSQGWFEKTRDSLWLISYSPETMVFLLSAQRLFESVESPLQSREGNKTFSVSAIWGVQHCLYVVRQLPSQSHESKITRSWSSTLRASQTRFRTTYTYPDTFNFKFLLCGPNTIWGRWSFSLNNLITMPNIKEISNLSC